MDVGWGPWTVLAEIASRDGPERLDWAVKRTQFIDQPEKGAHGHVTLAFPPCVLALPVQIGMSWRIRVDNLFRAIVRDLQDVDRFVRS